MPSATNCSAGRIADRDYVVVGVTPETMLASGFRPVGRDFPVFLHPETNEEYALARTERKHGRGYRGFEFFASPDVTLEEDLARRDLTINAMARGEDGVSGRPAWRRRPICAAGLLRHVSPAFVEDPLRVLRVARFAARLGLRGRAGNRSADADHRGVGRTRDAGAGARSGRNSRKGLSEARPSRMLAVLRECGALARLLPEVDALFGVPIAARARALRSMRACMSRRRSTGRRSTEADSPRATASSRWTLASRRVPRAAWPVRNPRAVQGMRLAGQIVGRLKVPDRMQRRRAACRTLARNGARAPPNCGRRRCSTCCTRRTRCAVPHGSTRCSTLARRMPARGRARRRTIRRQHCLRDALAVVKSVDAGAIAREVATQTGRRSDDDIAKAVRAARLKALRAWRRARPAGARSGTRRPSSRSRRRASVRARASGSSKAPASCAIAPCLRLVVAHRGHDRAALRVGIRQLHPM